jgi:cholesterol oxidase
MDEFDVVIIGSGFGGSVTAYRLADARFSVCVLERGRSYPPNSFARSPHSFSQNFWDPARQSFGLFNLWSFEHMDAIVSAGLGGGSLIYANVLIRKDENWFVSDVADTPHPWPISRAELDPHYDAVERVLGGQVFPMDSPGYRDVRKTAEFKNAAAKLGFEPTTHDRVDAARRQWYLPLLAVTFANEGRPPVPGETIREQLRNLHDRDRQTCRLCGECDIGCNYGAKNTLDYNFLTMARAVGANLRTLAEVKTFAPSPAGEGYLVNYIQHPEATPVAVRARHLVLAAGSLGSTYLLLRNREALPRISSVLGQRFSGNGDMLTFALSAHERAPDGSRRPRLVDPSHGPVITSTLRSPDELDGANAGDRGFYLQDAGYPGFLDWLVQAADLRHDLPHLLRFVARRIGAHLLHREGADLDTDLEELLADTELSAGSMPLLGMGRDVPDGIFQLDAKGRLALNWTKRESQPFYARVVDISHKIADELDATFIEDPLTKLFQRLVTVHPLGGCPMGKVRQEGVVDPWGRVHGHPDLHVADGSVLPGPVGANPSLTIAAIADRFADQMIIDLGK